MFKVNHCPTTGVVPALLMQPVANRFHDHGVAVTVTHCLLFYAWWTTCLERL